MFWVFAPPIARGLRQKARSGRDSLFALPTSFVIQRRRDARPAGWGGFHGDLSARGVPGENDEPRRRPPAIVQLDGDPRRNFHGVTTPQGAVALADGTSRYLDFNERLGIRPLERDEDRRRLGSLDGESGLRLENQETDVRLVGLEFGDHRMALP